VRHLRILYPLVGWLLSGGDALRLLWVLPAINLGAIAALAAVGALLALRSGLSSWWGFLLPIAVNAGLPALRDLTDNLSVSGGQEGHHFGGGRGTRPPWADGGQEGHHLGIGSPGSWWWGRYAEVIQRA
jgi:hypothetical protein